MARLYSLKKTLRHIIIGVSGIAGSFSEEAAAHYAHLNAINPEIVYAIDMEGVLRKLDRNQIRLGIFPVHNSINGVVIPAMEAMGRHRFKVIDSFRMKINQCLIIKKGISAQAISKVSSYPVAIAQCRRYLARHFPHAKLLEHEDTALAAKDLACGRLEDDTAVIASALAAKAYGLQVFAKNIQDLKVNYTTFLVVKK